MSKDRAELHKEVSSMLSGVPLPKDNAAPRPDISVQERRKGTAPSHLAGPEPEPQQGVPQPTTSLPKAAPTNRNKARTAARTTSHGSWRQVKNKFFAPQAGVSATKQKAMAILVPVLFIVLIFVLVQVFGTATHRTRAGTEKGTGQTTAAADLEINWQIPAPYPTMLRDPMQLSSLTTAQAEVETPKTGEPEIGRLIVKGVLYSEDNPAAVINTQIVHEGDMISGATVVKIDRDEVVLEMNGKRWTRKVDQ